MFSADVFLHKHDFPPKNGPVPIQAVNAYSIESRELFRSRSVQRVASSARQSPAPVMHGGSQDNVWLTGQRILFNENCAP